MKQIVKTFFFFGLLFSFTNVAFANKYIRLYPQKKSFATNTAISFSLFVKDGEKATVTLIPLSEKQFNDFSVDPWSLSFQDKIKKINLKKLKPILTKKYKVKEGANYLSLKQKVKSGFYLMTAKLSNRVISTSTILISDLGIIAKQSENDLLILTTNLKNGKPLAKTKVSLGLANKPARYNYTTDSAGLVKINLAKMRGLNLDKISIRAKKGNQIAQVFSGYSSYKDSRYQVFIDTDRPIYKPGHQVEWWAVVRRKQGGKYRVVSRKAVAIEVVNPGGNSLQKSRGKLDSFGKISQNFVAPKVSGGYFSILLTIDGEHHQADVLVKDYVKPEILVQVLPDQKAVVAGEKITGKIKAKFLFGAPVSDGSVTYQVYRGFYAPPQFKISSEERFFDITRRIGGGKGELVSKGTGTLDQEGEMSIVIETEPEHKQSVYSIRAVVSESDDYGAKRSVGGAKVKILAANITLSVRQENFIIAPNKTEVIRAKLNNLDGSPAGLIHIGLDIYKQTVASQSSEPGRLPKPEYEKVETKTFKSSKRGMGILTFSIKEQGYYKLVISAADKANNTVRSSIYYWVAKANFRANTGVFAEVNLKADKRFYRPNETARIILTTSIKNAHVLLTAEADDVYWQKMVKLKGNLKLFDLKLNDLRYLPNVYVTASIVHKGRLLSSALPIFISPKGQFIRLKFKRDKKQYRPGETATIQITATDSKKKPIRSSIAIAIVDEAVHLVQRRLSPAIEKFYYGRRPNRTRLSYSFPQVFTGGDAKDDTPPDVDRSDFKDTAFFKANVETNAKGQAQIKVKLPGNLTTWRLTATAVDKGQRVGSKKMKFISTKTLLARLSVPRFLNTSSVGTATGIVHNTSNKPVKITAYFRAKGLKVHKKKKFSATIGPRKRKAFVTKISGSKQNQKAYVNFYVKSAKFSDSLRKLVPVVETGIDHIMASNGLLLKANNSWQKGELVISDEILQKKIKAKDYELIFNPNLVASLLSSVSYMLEYPHGCVEQTTNKFLPNLQVMQFLRRHKIKHRSLEKKLSENINGGIRQLLNLQNKDRGGWGWWRSEGGHSVNSFMTAYALYGLATAKNAGYKVDKAAFNRGLDALQDQIFDIGPGKMSSIDQVDERKFPQEESFILFGNYVLSLAGRGDKTTTDAVYELRNQVTLESLAWGANTLKMQKETKAAAKLQQALLKRKKKNSFSEKFAKIERPNTSPTYYTALASAAVFGYKKNLEFDLALLEDLMRQRSHDGKFISTRDTAASLQAIMAFLDTHVEYLWSNLKVRYTNDGKEKTIHFTKKTPIDKLIRIKLDKKLIQAAAKTQKLTFKVDYQGKGLGMAYLRARVFEPTSKFTPKNNGIKVVRKYLPEGGGEDQKFSGVMKGGDAVNVQVKISAERGSYLFVTERIPPGFIVESDFDNSYGSSKVIVLKDRIYFYLESYYGSETLRYTLRAVNPGAYLVPPTQAEFMYNDTINGSSASEVIKVE